MVEHALVEQTLVEQKSRPTAYISYESSRQLQFQMSEDKFGVKLGMHGVGTVRSLLRFEHFGEILFLRDSMLRHLVKGRLVD
jgi:hypothetical protein